MSKASRNLGMCVCGCEDFDIDGRCKQCRRALSPSAEAITAMGECYKALDPLRVWERRRVFNALHALLGERREDKGE